MDTPSVWTRLPPLPPKRSETSSAYEIFERLGSSVLRYRDLAGLQDSWARMQDCLDFNPNMGCAVLVILVGKRWAEGIAWCCEAIDWTKINQGECGRILSCVIEQDDATTLRRLLPVFWPNHDPADMPLGPSLPEKLAAWCPAVLAVLIEEDLLPSTPDSAWGLAALQTQSPLLVQTLRHLWGGDPRHPEKWLASPTMSKEVLEEGKNLWLSLLEAPPEVVARAIEWGWGPPGDPGEWMWKSVQSRNSDLWWWWHSQPELKEAWLEQASEHPERVIDLLQKSGPTHRHAWWDPRLLACLEAIPDAANQVLRRHTFFSSITEEYAWWMEHAPLVLARDQGVRDMMEKNLNDLWPAEQVKLDTLLLEAELPRPSVEGERMRKPRL